MWTRRRRIALLLVAAGALLAAGAVVFVQTSMFQQALLRRLERQAELAGYHVTAQRLALDIWNLRASLEGLRYSDGTSITVTASRVAIDVPRNFRTDGNIRITSFETDGISIDIRADGSAPPSQPTSIEIPRITVDRLAIRNASLTYSGDGTIVRVPSFNIEAANGRGAARFAAPITMSSVGQIGVSEVPVAITSERIDFDAFDWRFEREDVDVSGSSKGYVQLQPVLEARLDSSTRPFTFGNWRDLEAAANVLYADSAARISDFRIRSGGGIATGSAVLAPGRQSVDMTWRELNLAPAGFAATSGGNLQVQWSASDLSDISGAGALQMRSRTFGRANADVRIERARATLDVRAAAFDSNIAARVTTGLDESLTGNFTVTNSRYGNVRLAGRLAGTIRNPEATAALAARDVRYGDLGPVEGSAKTSFKSGVIQIDAIETRLRNSASTMGNLRIELNTGRLTGELPDIRVEAGDFSPEAAGTAVMSATISGTIDRPFAEFSGAAARLDVAGTGVDNIRWMGNADTERLQLTELSAEGSGGTLSASGSLHLTTRAIDATARLNNVAIDQIEDLTATASLDAVIAGTIDQPTAEFNGTVADLRYRNEPHGDVAFNGRFRDDTVTARLRNSMHAAQAEVDIAVQQPYPFTAVLTANGSRLVYEGRQFVANGAVAASGELQPLKTSMFRFDAFTLRGEGLDLTAAGVLPDGVRIDATADLSRLPVPDLEASGEAQIHAVLSGTLEAPRIEGAVETSNASVRAAGMPEPATVRAAIDFTRDEFTVRTFEAQFAGARADIGGHGKLAGTGDFQFHADGIRPERMLNDRKIAGLLAVEGSVQVEKPSLDGIRATVKVTQLELNVANTPIHQLEPIEIGFSGQVLQANRIVLEGLNTHAGITGSADLGARTMDFRLDGDTDMKVIEAFLPGSEPAGQLRTSVTARGTFEQPDLQGFVDLAAVQLQIADPPLSISDANLRLQVRGDRIQIENASGTINGGMFSASGGADISSAGLGETNVQLVLTGAQTEYPEGFQSEISSRLSLKGSGKDFEISGDVNVLSGTYTRNIDLTQEIVSRIASASAQAALAQPAEPGLVDSIKLNVDIATPGFVTVANNLAAFDLEGSFRLRGTVANPVINGRAIVAEGGEIYFGPQVGVASATQAGRRDKYVITEGSIDFVNPVRTEPTFNFVATREVQTRDELYIITLRASGTPDDPKTELTSNPSLDEPNIVALLLTGRVLKDLQGSELTIAQEQAANYLSGRFGNLFQSAGSAFGLDTVRIDPVLLAGDEDLSAKLTIGRDITQNFNLVYSQNLSGPRAQTWIASYKALQDLLIRGINLSDENKLTVELRHDIKWGGGPELPRRPAGDERKLGAVTFDGSSLPAADLLREVTPAGKSFSVYRLNEDVRKLETFFAGRDFLTAAIRPVRTERDGVVDVRFVVREGPSITFEFKGAKVPRSMQEEIRQIWIRGFNETSSLRQSQARLLRHLRDEGYLQARVTANDVSRDSATRRFVFDIEPGTRFRRPDWAFRGIQPIDLGVTAGTVLEDPKAIQQSLVAALWRDGYLNASATEPVLTIDGADARFEISVERGPRYTIGKLTATDPAALEIIPPGEGGQKPGEGLFNSDWLERARQSVVSNYWQRGFNEVQVVPEVHTPDGGTAVDVHFKIEPGEQQIVSRIEIEGNKTTHADYVRRQFTFKEGDPVDHVRLNLTRKNLYETRLFRRVELSVEPGGNGYVARTRLNERPPWNVRYGFAVTDQLQTSDREFGATADFSYSNLLGKGITVGTSAKYTPDTRETRGFGSLPVFFGKNVTTTGAVFRTRDLSIEELVTDLWGFTAQQQWKLGDRYLLSYDYTYKKNHTVTRDFDPEDPFAFDLTFPVARFNATLSRDSRDDILNATRGTFFSNSFEIAPPHVGSSIEFVRNFTQHFHFRPVHRNLIWASGVRAGFAAGLHGQDLIPTERFQAGGGTTLRAFQQDQLGDPGNALFIVNQELRFPILWRFSGVGFFDAGNVYSTVRSFNPTRLRYSPGAGLRIQTPLVLIRFDAGWNVAAKPGEERYRFTFGVGQAF